MSSSASQPVILPEQTDVLQLLEQLSNMGVDLSQQMLSWGQGVFNNVSTITNANIGQYLQAADQAMGLANNTIGQYENQYVPEQNELLNEANSYNSEARIRAEMGSAESDTAQAMDQGQANAEQTLQSYGIDPSAGRYAGLEAAQKAQAAAAVAGAGQVARQNTEATGRNLMAQSIAVGEQLPGQAVNALNSGIQSIAGAENSILGEANTGANLMNVPAPYLNAGVNALKYPPQGQQTSAVSNAAGTRTGSDNDPFGMGNFGKTAPNPPNLPNDPANRPVGPTIADMAAPGAPQYNGLNQNDNNDNGVLPPGPIDPNLAPPVGYSPNDPNGGTSIYDMGVDPNLLQPNGYNAGSTMGTAANPFAGTPAGISPWTPTNAPSPTQDFSSAQPVANMGGVNNYIPQASNSPMYNPLDFSGGGGAVNGSQGAPTSGVQSGYTPLDNAPGGSYDPLSGSNGVASYNYSPALSGAGNTDLSGSAGYAPDNSYSGSDYNPSISPTGIGFGNNGFGGLSSTGIGGTGGGNFGFNEGQPSTSSPYSGAEGSNVGAYTSYDPSLSGSTGDYTGAEGSDVGSYTNYDPGLSGSSGSTYTPPDSSSGGYDPYSPNYNDYNSPGYDGGSSDNSGYSPGGFDGGGDYARGGMIHDMRRGGGVPPGASPSRGNRVDDVRANVNVGEFVVPRDVVQFKGHEFFQKLIAQTRKARLQGRQSTGGQNYGGQEMPQRPRHNPQHNQMRAYHAPGR